MPPRAAIDVGSNSLLLTICDEDEQVVHDEARVVGLGKGLGDRGLFAPDRMTAATEVFEDYVRLAKDQGVQPWSIKAVATSAARRAMNAETFFGRIHQRLGLKIRIIDGDEEARLTWAGAMRDLEVSEGPLLVADLGGGSTEVVLGQQGEILQRASLELGSARLTERFLTGDEQGRVDLSALEPMRDYIDAELARFEMRPTPTTVIGVAGTVTTLAATHLGLDAYDADRVHGCRLSQSDLLSFVHTLAPMTSEERREAIVVAPARAEFLVAGSTVLHRVLTMAGATDLQVSDRGLRFGLLG
ncbi:MAG: hypothetical protein KTR31_15555 [Myxococcales bacterium]|nr:hypothetical protein [Myxococcales bacterium]